MLPRVTHVSVKRGLRSPGARTRSAIARGVGDSKRLLAGRLRPHSSSSLENTRNASSEWPPISKKLSLTPTRSSPRSSAHIEQIVASSASLGAS